MPTVRFQNDEPAAAPAPGVWFTATEGEGPIVAVALHGGHDVNPALEPLYALGHEERRREEDPHTDRLTAIVPNRLVAHRSRFEVDLNRPRAQALYLRPEDAWGLEVWKRVPTPGMRDEILTLYDAFYTAAEGLLERLIARYGRIVVLDLHSYNHRRDGAAAPPADPAANPEVNVGTGSLPENGWRPLVERFMAELEEAGLGGRPLDVRENVRFRGGHFSRWVHATFPESACCLAVELKKIFMDEWSGELDPGVLGELEGALSATLPGLGEELARLAADAAVPRAASSRR